MLKPMWQLANVHGESGVLRLSAYLGNPESLHERNLDASGGSDVEVRRVPVYIDWFSDPQIEERTRASLVQVGKGAAYVVRTIKADGLVVDGPFFLAERGNPFGEKMVVHLQLLADEITTTFKSMVEMSIPFESEVYTDGRSM